nr:EAL-associated domain-containing protein [Shouchella shacheensis]
MDPLDVMMNKECVVPYFLPILSADKQLVIGYEVVARWQEGKRMSKLGWFFEDRSIPGEYRLEVEDYLQEVALARYIESRQQGVLYFNYDAKLLTKDGGETLIERLRLCEAEGVSLRRLIIGIKGGDMSEEVGSLKHTVMYLQSLGVQIAVDVDSPSTSQLDNLAILKPNVIRVNVSFLEETSLPALYRDVHQPMSMLARKIGATLLFDGLETFTQLNYAWRSGGRYYQGPYLQKAGPAFVERELCKPKLQKDMHHFIHYERQKVAAQLVLSNDLTQKLRQALKTIDAEDTYDQMIVNIARTLDAYTFRVYICNEDGFQQSSNAEKGRDGTWELYQEGRYKNWSWRPYFLENIARMNVEKKGILSDLYSDIERDEHIRTYSYPLTDTLYVFIDIPYEYLFEQNGLL